MRRGSDCPSLVQEAGHRDVCCQPEVTCCEVAFGAGLSGSGRGRICSELRCSGPLALSADLGHLGTPGTEGIPLGLGGSSRCAQLVLLEVDPRLSLWTQGKGCLQVPGLGLRVGPTHRETPTPVGRVWAPRDGSQQLRGWRGTAPPAPYWLAGTWPGDGARSDM